MIQSRLYLTMLGLILLGNSWLAQSQVIRQIDATTLSAMAELLDSYQVRFIAGSLTRIELDYAQQWLCPSLPTGSEMHLCNSSVVGTSDSGPDMDGGSNSQRPVIPNLGSDRIPTSICIKCLLKN